MATNVSSCIDPDLNQPSPVTSCTEEGLSAACPVTAGVLAGWLQRLTT
jgi:hypothetical protein